MLPVRPPAAAVTAEPRPLLPPAREILPPSATSATPSHDVAPSASASKKRAAVKKAVVTVPSGALAGPGPGSRIIGAAAQCHISMEPPAREQAPLKRSRTEVGQERCPTSGGETLPPDIQHPDITSTPTLSQFLSSGSKRKRMPRPTSITESERAEQVFANDEVEEDVGDHRVNEELNAGLDGEMDDGWSEQGYRGEDSDDFDRGYMVEGVVEPHMIDGSLHGEEDRQFRSKVWEEFTKIRVVGVVTKGQCVHCNTEINAKRGSGTSAMRTHLKRCKARMILGKGKLVHQRCAAHVLNLICKAGFQIINPIVHKARESVKYIEGSTSQKQKFEEIIQQLYPADHSPKLPKVDTCTRWNSTYLMLKKSIELKRAFESLGQQDSEYTFAPTSQEWEKAGKICELLKVFFDATKVISGSLYPTANLHFHEIWEIKLILDKQVPKTTQDPQLAETIQDSQLAETIEYMKRKFKKYWKM